MAEFTKLDRAYGKGYDLKVEGAQLIFKNFSGREDPWGNCDKTVNLVVDDEEIYHFLAADGWNFKTRKDPDGGFYEPFSEHDDQIEYPRTTLKIAYRDRNGNEKERKPQVYLVTDRNPKGTLLDEETINELDYAYIINADLVISPYYHGDNTKGYINLMYATIEDNPFADKYGDDIE